MMPISDSKRRLAFSVLNRNFGSPNNQQKGFASVDDAAHSAATLVAAQAKVSFSTANTLVREWYTQAGHVGESQPKRLDAFTRQYIDTALWSSTDNANESGGEPLDKNYNSSDIDPATMTAMIADCVKFQEQFADLLSASGIDDERAGHCLWLSRNGHGSGFFDEDTIDEEFQEKLQDAAESYGEVNLQVDDGVISDGTHWTPAGTNEARRRPMARARQHHVADFTTLPEIIAHAQQEGATHVLLAGRHTSLFFPTENGRYEEARVWREAGYWHAEAREKRVIVDGLPKGAEPIENPQQMTEAHQTSLEVVPSQHGGYVLRYPNGTFWTPSGPLSWPPSMWNGPTSGRWTSLEGAKRALDNIRRGKKPESDEPGVSESHMVRDYIAVDPGGRPVAGPFKDYSEAKKHADRARGHVEFKMGEAVRSSGSRMIRGFHVVDPQGVTLHFDQGYAFHTEAAAIAAIESEIDPRLRSELRIEPCEWSEFSIENWQQRGFKTREAARYVEFAMKEGRGRGVAATARRKRDPSARGRRLPMTKDAVMNLTNALSAAMGGTHDIAKHVVGGFRWSGRNESAQFTTYSPEYSQKVVVVVSIFEDGSSALNFFSDEGLSGTDTYENVGHFDYNGAPIPEMVKDIEWVWKTVDGYAESWGAGQDEADEA
jgi:hypothetical protein